MSTGEEPEYPVVWPAGAGVAYDPTTDTYWHMGEMTRPERIDFDASGSTDGPALKHVVREGEPLSAEELQARVDTIRDLAGEEVVKRVMEQLSREF